MKKSCLLLLFICFLSNTRLRAQFSESLSLKTSYNFHTYDMNELNNALSNGFLANQLNDSESTIHNGQNFQLNIAYQPIALFAVGIYGGYQFSNQKSTPTFYQMNEYNLPVKACTGRYELRNEAITVGLSTTWYISHLLKFQEKESLLKRFYFGIELNGGLGFSRISSDLQPPKDVPERKEYVSYSSQDFQGQIGLKAEYNFTNQPFISALGIRGGYQYFKTKTVKDRLGNEWKNKDEKPIYLDFSGFYFGVYLTIGR